jgi:hypothetical protein
MQNQILMTYRIVCSVRNNQLIIQLPPGFTEGGEVTVIVENQTPGMKEKIAMLQEAVHDPIFLADLQEVQDDFGSLQAALE